MVYTCYKFCVDLISSFKTYKSLYKKPMIFYNSTFWVDPSTTHANYTLH